MKLVSRKRYTAEFKAQAVSLVGLGKPVPEVAEELGIGEGILYKWVTVADELRRLRREVANLKLWIGLCRQLQVRSGRATSPSFPPPRDGLYPAVVIDLYSRRIVGWSLADHLRSELVISALQQALATRRDHLQRTIFHSDRGSHYGSTLFRDTLARAGMLQSMSARANPYHNAWSESFMSTLKREMLQGGCFEDANDARIEIFEYIDGYYNSHRKHSSLGYKSPPASSNLSSTHPTNQQISPKFRCTSDLT